MEVQSKAFCRALTLAELRADKPPRDAFLSVPRQPLTVVLDGVRGNHNLGAIFRLCDAFLVDRLFICGTRVDLRNRKLVQAARGTHRWVPWIAIESANEVVANAKDRGAYIIAAEQTATSVTPERLAPSFPAILVLGGETDGVSKAVLDRADVAVAIPMRGQANSLNVSTAAAILLHDLSRHLARLRGPPGF